MRLSTPPAERRQGRPLFDIGPLEADILSVVWTHQQVSVRDVYEELCLSRRIAYTTVMTVLTNLTQKGFVTQDRSNTAYLYAAAISRKQMTEAILDVLVAGLLGGDLQALADYVAGRARTTMSGATRAASSTSCRGPSEGAHGGRHAQASDPGRRQRPRGAM